MRRALGYTVAVALIALLPISQADARGGGGGGFHGGFAGPRVVAGARIGTVVTRSANGTLVRRPGSARHQPLAPFVTTSFQNRQFTSNGNIGSPFNGFATGFPNTVPTQLESGSPRLRNGWGNWTGPVGGWWPGDWGSGGYYGYANPPTQPAPPPEPQVIVIHADGQGRMTTAEAPADFSYVKGC